MKMQTVFTIVSLVALTLSLITIIYMSTLPLEGEWRCSQIVCSRFMTQDEWVKNFCFLNESAGEMYCNVLINNVPYTVPLSMLNLSSITQCSEYKCIEEVRVRKANYTIGEI